MEEETEISSFEKTLSTTTDEESDEGSSSSTTEESILNKIRKNKCLNGEKFFKNFLFNSKNFKQNLKKTKKVFKFFYSDFKNFDIPLLQSYGKNYNLDFSLATVKKFSRYNNIIIFGIGGRF